LILKRYVSLSKTGCAGKRALEERKAGAPALQAEFSTGLSITDYKGKSIGKRVPVENV
jgi:hypothetical protein